MSRDVNSVIHYDSGVDEDGILSVLRRKRSAAVRQTSLERFAGSAGPDAIELVERPHDAENVLRRAYSAIRSELWAEGTYHLLSNNCEHFARWCVKGWGSSQQVVNYSFFFAQGTGSVAAVLCWAGPGIGTALVLGWLLVAVAFVALAYGLASGLGVFCNGNSTALDEGVQFA